MGNSIKKEYDRLPITKDIVERQNIIRQFQITGFLDRNNAIKKIESIQVTDAELTLATIAKQAQSGSVDLTEPPTMASVRERSSIVRFIGNTRTSAEHTSSMSPCWSEWC